MNSRRIVKDKISILALLPAPIMVVLSAKGIFDELGQRDVCESPCAGRNQDDNTYNVDNGMAAACFGNMNSARGSASSSSTG